MSSISIVADTPAHLLEMRKALPDGFEADFLQLPDLEPRIPHDITILDIELVDPAEVQRVKEWLARCRNRDRVIVCIDDACSHWRATQARALGATDILTRSVLSSQLQRLLADTKRGRTTKSSLRIDDPSQDIDAMDELFASAASGQIQSIALANKAAQAIAERLKYIGLAGYLTAIRAHHNSTYTHCLTVTAVATAFGIQLGFSRRDTERLTLAGLLHDIGKSQIPLDILEKPAALDAQELRIMKTHPLLGYELLQGSPDIQPDTLDMVLHHHEYLDGSGYPHGVHGTQISDLNRLITIADVFTALIEPRAYKTSLSPAHALGVMQRMTEKLDMALLRVFSPLALRLEYKT